MINESWDNILSTEYDKPYFKQLMNNVDEEYRTHTVYPPKDKLFAALKYVSYDNVRVVILGQDPYHGAGQANGMAFAVSDGIALPPSLVNIYKEIEDDIGVKPQPSGTLIGWAKQGVLLLNTVLSVRAGNPLSHAHLGWQEFTDSIITQLNKRETPVIYILWGAGAIAKKSIISPRSYIISSPHPSPLSAYRGFFGSKPFSKANKYLTDHGFAPIDWTDTSGIEKVSYYKTAKSIHKV
ncbi:MAG: uracil-DNA glycosylase [Clostridiales bacterium]|nr:uracil-DNA glycosylase [Clostridiales bacterium]